MFRSDEREKVDGPTSGWEYHWQLIVSIFSFREIYLLKVGSVIRSSYLVRSKGVVGEIGKNRS